MDSEPFMNQDMIVEGSLKGFFEKNGILIPLLFN